ncbi:MAG: TIGR02996 domain-containing protein [Myxococcales bacterium]
MTADAAEALLASALAEPDRDEPRLVLADLWQQQGDPRGELIAVQCALAKAEQRSDEALRLRVREGELVRTHGGKWLRELGLAAGEGTFRRGLLESVTLGPGRIEALTSRLFEAGPLRELHIAGKLSPRDGQAVADLPRLPRELWFDNRAAEGIGDKGMQALAQSEALRDVRLLGLRNNGVADRGAKALAACAHLAGLEGLDLDGNDLTAPGLKALAESDHLSNLRTLLMYRNTVGVAGAEALAASASLRHLKRLRLYAAGIKDAGTRAIAGALTELEYLDLGKVPVEKAMPALAGLRELDKLEALQVGRLRQGPHRLRAGAAPEAARAPADGQPDRSRGCPGAHRLDGPAGAREARAARPPLQPRDEARTRGAVREGGRASI